MSDAFPQPCPQWADRLAALHPHDLSETEQAELLAHTATCPACAAALADYQRFAERLRQLPERASHSALPPRLGALWNESSKREEQGDP